MKVLLKEFINLILNESKSIGEKIVDKSNGRLRLSGSKKGAIRLAPTTVGDDIDESTMLSILKKEGATDIREILPGDEGSLSGKFVTYNFSLSGSPVNVVIGQGRNEGQKFEDQISKEATAAIGGNISPRMASLFDAMEINPNTIKKIEQTGGANTKRPISRNVLDVGKIISDLTLVLSDNSEVYVSLKNPSGNTFANTGYAGGFIQKGDKVVSASHPSDEFLEALGVNKDLAAKGFTNVLRGELKPVAQPTSKYKKTNEPVDFVDPVGTQDYGLVQKYIASGYGYGYWYARSKGGSDWYVRHIATEDDALELVGDVLKIDVSYPGVTKQITASVITTKGRYIIEIRNTKGGIVPNQLNIKIG